MLHESTTDDSVIYLKKSEAQNLLLELQPDKAGQKIMGLRDSMKSSQGQTFNENLFKESKSNMDMKNVLLGSP